MSVSTILQFISKDNFKFLYIGILVIATGGLFFAYYVEYILGIEPCPLCIYQRFPYLYLIKLSITGLVIRKISKYVLISIMLTLLVGIVLAGYHAGVESGIFAPSNLCANIIHIPKNLSINEIKKILYDGPVASCSKVGFKLFYVSLTIWNLLLNLGILTIVIISYLFFNKTHAKTFFPQYSQASR